MAGNLAALRQDAKILCEGGFGRGDITIIFEAVH